MWSIQSALVENDKTILYQIFNQNKALTFGEMIKCWQADDAFCAFFCQTLAQALWPAFYWEMPPLCQHTLDHPAEFVLVNSPTLLRASPDASAFQAYFESHTDGVVCFMNLGGDARLLAPVPQGENENYTHMASFVRYAPVQQQVAIFQQLGHLLQKHLSTYPLWVSTSGLGVHWLHIRLDEQPKYYQYLPYRKVK
jgi:hypothetical protein